MKKDLGKGFRWRLELLREARRVLSECPEFVEYLCGPKFAYLVKPPKRIITRIQKDRAIIQSMQVIPPANKRRYVLVNLYLKAPTYVAPWISPVSPQAANVSIQMDGYKGERELGKALVGTDVNRFHSPRSLAYNIGFADKALWDDLEKEPVPALHSALLLGLYTGWNPSNFNISEPCARYIARVADEIIYKFPRDVPSVDRILATQDLDVFGAPGGQSKLTWPSPANPYDDYARERVPTLNDKLLAPVMLWGGEWEHLTGHAMQVLNKINKVTGKILRNAKVDVKDESPEDRWEMAKAIEREKARGKQKNNLRLILRLERHYAQLQAKVTTKRLAGLRYLQRTVPYMLQRFPVKGIAYENLSFQKAGLTAPASFTGAAAQAMKSMPKRFGAWVAWACWYLKEVGMRPSGGLSRAAVWAGGTSQVCARHPSPPLQGYIDRQGSNDTGACSVGREEYHDWETGEDVIDPEIVISHDSAAGIIAYRGHALLDKKDAEREEKKRQRDEAARGITGVAGTGPLAPEQ